MYMSNPGLPRSGKNIWKMKYSPGKGKVREFCGWSGKFRKEFESQGKVREFENKWLWQAVFRKFIYCLACEAEAIHMYCFSGSVVVVIGDVNFFVFMSFSQKL